MNRTIKFRVWDKLRKCYVGPDGIYKDEFLSVALGFHSFVCIDKDCLVVQQFTGVLDKNGVEIYEGDIVKDTITVGAAANGEESRLDVIRFYYGSFMIDCEPMWNYISPNNPDVLEDFEVVGNLFENPELLKQ